MKKIAIILLISLLVGEADAQMLFAEPVASASLPGLSASNELSSMMMKKKRRKSKRGRGKKGAAAGAMGVGGGLVIGLPMGDFGDAVNMGMGLSVDGDYFVSSSLSVGVSTGYTRFGYKTDLVDKGSFSIIPFQLKASYYFMEDDIKPYAGLGIGFFFDHSKYEFTIPTYFLNPVTQKMDTINLKTTVTDKTTDLAISPTFGVLFNLADNLSLNVNARYNMFWLKDQFAEGTKSEAYLGFQVGVRYMIGQ